MRESVLPTVARTKSIGGATSNHFINSWICQNDIKLGAEVVSIAVVALSSSKLMDLSAAAGMVLVQPDVEDVVSRSFFQESVTFEELSDDDAVTKTVVHNTEQFTATRSVIGRKPWTWGGQVNAALTMRTHKNGSKSWSETLYVWWRCDGQRQKQQRESKSSYYLHLRSLQLHSTCGEFYSATKSTYVYTTPSSTFLL